MGRRLLLLLSICGRTGRRRLGIRLVVLVRSGVALKLRLVQRLARGAWHRLLARRSLSRRWILVWSARSTRSTRGWISLRSVSGVGAATRIWGTRTVALRGLLAVVGWL
jgi:hypothetical protein